MSFTIKCDSCGSENVTITTNPGEYEHEVTIKCENPDCKNTETHYV